MAEDRLTDLMIIRDRVEPPAAYGFAIIAEHLTSPAIAMSQMTAKDLPRFDENELADGDRCSHRRQ